MSEPLPPMIETPKGLYRHYKGGQYRVLDTVRHSENLQPMTLYQALYGEQGLWVRLRPCLPTWPSSMAKFNRALNASAIEPKIERPPADRSGALG
jgi:hypothetical protein